MSQSKVYTRRDSAVAVLRKMGIDKESYSRFIEPVDGGFKLNLKPAAKVVEEPKVELPPKKSESERQSIVRTRRDAATADLRRMGIKKEDYDRFIDKRPEGFVVKLKLAQEYLESVKPRKSPVLKRVTCSGRCRELILEGKTNEQAWLIIQKEFNLNNDKKHYPSWYRSQMKRKGLLKDA